MGANANVPGRDAGIPAEDGNMRRRTRDSFARVRQKVYMCVCVCVIQISETAKCRRSKEVKGLQFGYRVIYIIYRYNMLQTTRLPQHTRQKPEAGKHIREQR
ncbi:hypothetical protein HMPREF1981_02686 [Bacteroides pyogenes F0041]|uniref:Uncharacterized protein n=1 Tax=Bacteroides pyogenes F0041 TaxID=1321819 RepID=U2DQJ8_9BACE|nr:hypothetical protein HMPREF1981_02686 [Bacteroides pyogenes F0041]